MNDPKSVSDKTRLDVCSLEADIAFFEARLSLAGDAPDTAYQRAQIKTYQTLGVLLGQRLDRIRPPRKAAPRGTGKDNAAA